MQPLCDGAKTRRTIMTVKELIMLLLEQDLTLEVVLQKDAEGNGYSPLEGGDPAYYVPTSTWSGEVYDEDEEGEELPEDGHRAMILWPVN
jgi:hypothetical protein